MTIFFFKKLTTCNGVIDVRFFDTFLLGKKKTDSYYSGKITGKIPL